MTSFELERVKLFHIAQFPTFEECLRYECEALCFSECENLWIPKEKIGHSSSLAIEIFIAHIYNSITRSMVSSDFAGVEFWVQVRITDSTTKRRRPIMQPWPMLQVIAVVVCRSTNKVKGLRFILTKMRRRWRLMAQ